MVQIGATIVRGYGAAHKCIELQFKHVLEEVPEIINIHKFGTLNLRLEFPLRIHNPDHTTKLIDWTPPDPKERFSLTKIVLVLLEPTLQQEAWIYVAHNSPHRGDPLFAELLTATIENPTPDRNGFIALPPFRYGSMVTL